MPKPLSPDMQDLIAALPESGDVAYEVLRNTLLAAGKKRALNRFHDMRRAGHVHAEVRVEDGERVLFVSRQPFAQPEGSAE